MGVFKMFNAPDSQFHFIYYLNVLYFQEGGEERCVIETRTRSKTGECEGTCSQSCTVATVKDTCGSQPGVEGPEGWIRVVVFIYTPTPCYLIPVFFAHVLKYLTVFKAYIKDFCLLFI